MLMLFVLQRLATSPVQRIVYASQPGVPMYAPMYTTGVHQPVVMVPGSVGPMPMYYSYPPPQGRKLDLISPQIIHHIIV